MPASWFLKILQSTIHQKLTIVLALMIEVLCYKMRIQHEDKEQAHTHCTNVQSIIVTYPEYNKGKVFQMYLSVSYWVTNYHWQSVCSQHTRRVDIVRIYSKWFTRKVFLLLVKLVTLLMLYRDHLSKSHLTSLKNSYWC